MRKVRKMLSDTELLREINRQKGKDATNGVIDETVIETIMSHIPLISNRSILKTLSILRKKLPKEIFKFRNPSRIICVMSKQLQGIDISHCISCFSFKEQVIVVLVLVMEVVVVLTLLILLTWFTLLIWFKLLKRRIMSNHFIHICLVPMFQWERPAEG